MTSTHPPRASRLRARAAAEATAAKRVKTDADAGSPAEPAQPEVSATPPATGASYMYLAADDEGVRCTCLGQHEAPDLACCDVCETWQHLECELGPGPSALPEPYVCSICAAERVPERVRTRAALVDLLTPDAAPGADVARLAAAVEMHFFLQWRPAKRRHTLAPRYFERTRRLLAQLKLPDQAALRRALLDDSLAPLHVATMSHAELRSFARDDDADSTSEGDGADTPDQKHLPLQDPTTIVKSVETQARVTVAAGAKPEPRPARLSAPLPSAPLVAAERDNLSGGPAVRPQAVQASALPIAESETMQAAQPAVQRAGQPDAQPKNGLPAQAGTRVDTLVGSQSASQPETPQDALQDPASAETAANKTPLGDSGDPQALPAAQTVPETSTETAREDEPMKSAELESAAAAGRKGSLSAKQRQKSKPKRRSGPLTPPIEEAVDAAASGADGDAQVVSRIVFAEVPADGLPQVDVSVKARQWLRAAVFSLDTEPSDARLGDLDVVGLALYKSLESYLAQARAQGAPVHCFGLITPNGGRFLNFLCARGKLGVCLPTPTQRSLHIMPAFEAYARGLVTRTETDALLVAIVVLQT